MERKLVNRCLEALRMLRAGRSHRECCPLLTSVRHALSWRLAGMTSRPDSGLRFLRDSRPGAQATTLGRARPLVVLAVGLLYLTGSLVAQTPDLTPAEIALFLETGEVVAAEPIGVGVTKPWRLTLSDGVTTHDAAFQSVDERKASVQLGRRRELNFVDSYRYNIAAYRLASLLGLGHMMPVTVERTWDGNRGALSWWIDDVMFDETARQEQRRWPEDMQRWTDQMYRMRLFAELVYDTDRNKGNILYASDWSLYMLDFSRAFRKWSELQRVDDLVRCDRVLFDRLTTLTKDEVGEATGGYLTGPEIDGVMTRRDLLIEHFQALIASRGADRIFY